MGNGVNFKDLCIDLRGKLDRVTAERDAALNDEESLRESLRTQTLVINSIANARDAALGRESALQQRLTAAEFHADYRHGMLEKVAQGWACRMGTPEAPISISACNGMKGYSYENHTMFMAVYDPAHIVFSECDTSKNNDPINGYPVGGECPECIKPAEVSGDE